jgi:dTDP-glucose 4,6-dehydratase
VTTVLVTGAGGFVGSHVVENILTRTDWRVVGLDSFRHNGEFVKLLDSTGHDTSRVGVLVHDLRVPLSTRSLRDLEGVDYVVNVASRSHVRESILEPAEFVLNNVQLAVHVLELCRALEPTRLVHVSTDEVHGPGAYHSEVEHRPSSPYAASKAAQADLVWAYARTYGVPTTVVASANMFGERQGATAYVPLVVRSVVTGTKLRVHHDDDGQPGERAYSYVRNVAGRLVDELTSPTPAASDAPVAYVALRGQRRVDNLTLARRVAELLGRDLRWEAEFGAASRPGYDPTYHDVGDAWEAAVDFDDALARTVRALVADIDRYEGPNGR